MSLIECPRMVGNKAFPLFIYATHLRAKVSEKCPHIYEIIMILIIRRMIYNDIIYFAKLYFFLKLSFGNVVSKF
jgi:hypothetical protein